MRPSTENFITSILLLCAVTTTGLVVKREYFDSPEGASHRGSAKPVFRKDWKSFLRIGHTIGSSNAQVRVIEFADFECPFCAQFNEDFKDIRRRYGARVSLTFVHLPLAMHRFAAPAARASECADRQGRFAEMANQLFESQASFGLKNWGEFASAAGVADRPAFDKCMAEAIAPPSIRAGQSIARQLNIVGTPTLIVNGWQFPPMGKGELESTISDLLAGRPPKGADK